jgi:hypothetical protein
MYDGERGLFAFRVRPGANGVVREGISPRYTAITLIGLAEEPAASHRIVLGSHTAHEVGARLMSLVPKMSNLGDVALTLWAARAIGDVDCEPAEKRLLELDPVRLAHPTVEVAWALTASCLPGVERSRALAEPLAHRLQSAQHARSLLFPHTLGETSASGRHVSCYADLVYPIQALSKFALMTGNHAALNAAARCAERLCELQGNSGQWWWHYDYRTGQIIERYPVYAIHQDAMGPMALFALRQAGGPNFADAVAAGMDWLVSAPELDGGSLIDKDTGVIWRKVARREPRKLARYLNAAASRLSPSLRAPGLDVLLPAGAIDFEDRPYHLGWLLFAWSPRTCRPSAAL